jgi:hypothetical protein
MADMSGSVKPSPHSPFPSFISVVLLVGLLETIENLKQYLN